MRAYSQILIISLTVFANTHVLGDDVYTTDPREAITTKTSLHAYGHVPEWQHFAIGKGGFFEIRGKRILVAVYRNPSFQESQDYQREYLRWEKGFIQEKPIRPNPDVEWALTEDGILFKGQPNGSISEFALSQSEESLLMEKAANLPPRDDGGSSRLLSIDVFHPLSNPVLVYHLDENSSPYVVELPERLFSEISIRELYEGMGVDVSDEDARALRAFVDRVAAIRVTTSAIAEGQSPRSMHNADDWRLAYTEAEPTEP